MPKSPDGKDDAAARSLDPRIKALSDELDKCTRWHPPSREAYCKRLLAAIDGVGCIGD